MLAAFLRANAWAPPVGGLAAALGHDVVHGLDITVALGLDRCVLENRLYTHLRPQTSGRPTPRRAERPFHPTRQGNMNHAHRLLLGVSLLSTEAPDDLGVPFAAVARQQTELLDHAAHVGPYPRTAALVPPSAAARIATPVHLTILSPSAPLPEIGSRA
ncbi:hypothetical protein [Streptomyces lateritius]|uniref:hypothetical protein n=1 Tax=Streptomyces lateritius TaxID=67313 RepID=UPI0019829E61|nr:hypothetical protein GCM10010272_52680 [Streptomyces lateritius]